MHESRAADRSPESSPIRSESAAPYERPSFEVISLGCEITAYAPDGDDPLF